MSPSSDCRELAKRIAIGLRLMAKSLEDPLPMNESIEEVERLPSEELAESAELAAVDAAAPMADRQSLPDGIARISASRLRAIAGFSPSEFRSLASMPDDEFEKAQRAGFATYLRGPTRRPLLSCWRPLSSDKWRTFSINSISLRPPVKARRQPACARLGQTGS
jgi:hypothetical protein